MSTDGGWGDRADNEEAEHKPESHRCTKREPRSKQQGDIKVTKQNQASKQTAWQHSSELTASVGKSQEGFGKEEARQKSESSLHDTENTENLPCLPVIQQALHSTTWKKSTDSFCREAPVMGMTGTSPRDSNPQSSTSLA